MAFEELLLHLVEGIVNEPDDVSVTPSERRGEPVLAVRVLEDDRGAVIGRQGRTIRALETVLKAAAGDGPVPPLEVVDDEA